VAEVRDTLLATLRQHLYEPLAPGAWCGLTVDLRGAVLAGGSLSGVQLTGGALLLDGARFTGDVDLSGIRLQEGRISLNGAVISGRLLLDAIDVEGGELVAHDVQVLGGAVLLDELRVRGGRLELRGWRCRNAEISIQDAEFSGGHVVLDDWLLDDTGLALHGSRAVVGVASLHRIELRSGAHVAGGAHLLAGTSRSLADREAEPEAGIV
jgi:hypothetical protein